MASPALSVKECKHILRQNHFNFDRFATKKLEAFISECDETDRFDLVHLMIEFLTEKKASEHSINTQLLDETIKSTQVERLEVDESTFRSFPPFKAQYYEFNRERRMYVASTVYSKFTAALHGNGNRKSEMFRERFALIKSRCEQAYNFRLGRGDAPLKSVDDLQGMHGQVNTMVFGMLVSTGGGKWMLEDCYSRVELEGLENPEVIESHREAFFYEGCFVLVTGETAGTLFKVVAISLPPVISNTQIRRQLGSADFFTGQKPFTERQRSRLFLAQEDFYDAKYIIFNNLWFDEENAVEKLRLYLERIDEGRKYPTCMVLMGDFISNLAGKEGKSRINCTMSAFKTFGSLLRPYKELRKQTIFVFVPGLEAVGASGSLPRKGLFPGFIKEFEKASGGVKRVINDGNPTRIRFLLHDTIFIADKLLSKMSRSAIHMPSDLCKVPRLFATTLLSQCSISPFMNHTTPTYWDYDFVNRMYVNPDCIVLTDTISNFNSEVQGCHVINAGKFCNGTLEVNEYSPFTREIYVRSLFYLQKAVKEPGFDESYVAVKSDVKRLKKKVKR